MVGVDSSNTERGRCGLGTTLALERRVKGKVLTVIVFVSDSFRLETDRSCSCRFVKQLCVRGARRQAALHTLHPTDSLLSLNPKRTGRRPAIDPFLASELRLLASWKLAVTAR